MSGVGDALPAVDLDVLGPGETQPVAGATVTGASGPTGADGSVTVTLAASASLRATHGKEIPSAAAAVFILRKAAQKSTAAVKAEQARREERKRAGSTPPPTSSPG